MATGRQLTGIALVAVAVALAGAGPAGAGTSGPLTVTAAGSTCNLNGSVIVSWTAQSSASEPLTIDGFVASNPVGGQAFSPNPVPAGGTSTVLTGGPSAGGTSTITVTYHGSDNVPRTAMGSTTVGPCQTQPCVTAPGGCFPSSTTSTTGAPGPSSTSVGSTSTARGTGSTARPTGVAAQPRFTG
jgi:hypothetical protein